MNDLITRIVNISGLSRIVNLTKTEEEANYLVEGMYEKIHKLRV